MTKSQRMRLSAVMISSTMPSTKYSCSGSPLIFANGNTAIDGLSGRAGPELARIIDEPARSILLNAGRDADAARLGQSFEPGGDIDAVPKDVAILDDDVAHVDAD